MICRNTLSRDVFFAVVASLFILHSTSAAAGTLDTLAEIIVPEWAIALDAAQNTRFGGESEWMEQDTKGAGEKDSWGWEPDPNPEEARIRRPGFRNSWGWEPDPKSRTAASPRTGCQQARCN